MGKNIGGDGKLKLKSEIRSKSFVKRVSVCLTLPSLSSLPSSSSSLSLSSSSSLSSPPLCLTIAKISHQREWKKGKRKKGPFEEIGKYFLFFQSMMIKIPAWMWSRKSRKGEKWEDLANFFYLEAKTWSPQEKGWMVLSLSRGITFTPSLNPLRLTSNGLKFLSSSRSAPLPC